MQARFRSTASATAVLCAVIASSVCAQSPDQFYSGRQLTLIVGAGPGGGNDLYARLLAQYMSNYIPGKPTLVVQNMPPAAGVAAANYMYNIAPKDGSVIATVPSGVFLAEAISSSQIRFNSLKFDWIGTITTTTDLLAVFKSSGVTSIDEAKQKTAVVGATSQYALSALEPGLANALLRTKFRIVNGYSGSGDTLNLAMERHEIDGRTNQWASWRVLRPDWIRQNKLAYLLQFGPKAVDLPNVPTLGELVTNPDDRAVVSLLEISQYVGRSIFAPPGIPAERAAALRKAFEDTMRDAAFIAKVHASGLDLNPRSAEETQQAISRTMTNREAVVARLKSEVQATR